MTKKTEYRSGELRAVNDEGEFEGYLTVWDTVDSYNSTFKRGSFAKTINERSNKIKIMYDHEHLVGSSIELREDDYGVFGRGRLNLNVEKAKEAYEFMKDGTLDGLSFGFRTIKEGFESGIRQIKEVMLYEFGPVTFPANDAALITDVRATNFDETLSDNDLRSAFYRINEALFSTLGDIWWDSDRSNTVAMLDAAISDYHASYLEHSQAFINRFWSDESRSAPGANELSEAVLETRKTAEQLATETSLTVDEAERLKRGNLIDARQKLSELPDTIRAAHQKQRISKIETLCAELRTGLTEAEKRRITALLQPAIEQSQPDESQAIIDYLQSLRN